MYLLIVAQSLSSRGGFVVEWGRSAGKNLLRDWYCCMRRSRLCEARELLSTGIPDHADAGAQLMGVDSIF